MRASRSRHCCNLLASTQFLRTSADISVCSLSTFGPTPSSTTATKDFTPHCKNPLRGPSTLARGLAPAQDDGRFCETLPSWGRAAFELGLEAKVRGYRICGVLRLSLADSLPLRMTESLLRRCPRGKGLHPMSGLRRRYAGTSGEVLRLSLADSLPLRMTGRFCETLSSWGRAASDVGMRRRYAGTSGEVLRLSLADSLPLRMTESWCDAAQDDGKVLCDAAQDDGKVL